MPEIVMEPATVVSSEPSTATAEALTKLPPNVVPACLIVDDFPINGSYWARLQQSAFGYTPIVGGEFGRDWQAQAVAPYCPLATIADFADLCEEQNLRGKFTVLPCPGGLGRLDQQVRLGPPGYIPAMLDLVRARLAPRFDITPEVLTHAMAYDPETGSMLPHTETGWLSHLAKTGREDALASYLDHAWAILTRVGLSPRGLTVGGIPDLSNIAEGELLTAGHHRAALAEVLSRIQEQYAPGQLSTFMFCYGKPTSPPYKKSWLPEPVWQGPGGRVVYELLSGLEEPLLSVYYGRGEVAAAVDKLVTPDLNGGAWIGLAEAGRPVVVTIHAQTMTACNTPLGMAILRQAVRRLRQRYGSRLCWLTATELCELSRQRHGLH
jgi:hypothetical protein